MCCFCLTNNISNYTVRKTHFILFIILVIIELLKNVKVQILSISLGETKFNPFLVLVEIHFFSDANVADDA